MAPAEAREQRSEVVATANSAGTSPFLILCDHASNHIPPEHRFLGLGPKERSAHIAWDPGALEVARRLAQALDAALVHSTVSRLVIDCNRPLDAPDLIAAVSETTPVPSNAALGEAERQRRIESVHVPYHRAIERLLAERLAAGRETFLVALHSFTPVYRGIARPWQVGVIFDRDRRLAEPLIAALKADGLTVGVNEPYSPADRVYYTLTRHGEARGLPAVMIEIRNDLIADEAGQREWAERLARTLAAAAAAVHAG